MRDKAWECHCICCVCGAIGMRLAKLLLVLDSASASAVCKTGMERCNAWRADDT